MTLPSQRPSPLSSPPRSAPCPPAARRPPRAGSQVCNLSWSKNVNELVSTHGYSQNQIIVWRYPSMSKMATLTGHTMRVLYLAVSPDGQTIVTGARAGAGRGAGCGARGGRRAPLGGGRAGAGATQGGWGVCACMCVKRVKARCMGHGAWGMGVAQPPHLAWRQRLESGGRLAALEAGLFEARCALRGSRLPNRGCLSRRLAPRAGAGDETLRFWNVFPGPKAQGQGGTDSGMGSLMRTLIR